MAGRMDAELDVSPRVRERPAAPPASWPFMPSRCCARAASRTACRKPAACTSFSLRISWPSWACTPSSSIRGDAAARGAPGLRPRVPSGVPDRPRRARPARRARAADDAGASPGRDAPVCCLDKQGRIRLHEFGRTDDLWIGAKMAVSSPSAPGATRTPTVTRTLPIAHRPAPPISGGSLRSYSLASQPKGGEAGEGGALPSLLTRAMAALAHLSHTTFDAFTNSRRHPFTTVPVPPLFLARSAQETI